MVALRAAANDPHLPKKADAIVFVDVYHHVDARVRYLQSLRKSLVPGGHVAVIDFRMDSLIGPPRAARIDPEQVKREFEQAGFRLIDQPDFLPNQYFFVFGLRTD